VIIVITYLLRTIEKNVVDNTLNTANLL